MNEQMPINSEYLNLYPGAVQDPNLAHDMAIAGNEHELNAARDEAAMKYLQRQELMGIEPQLTNDGERNEDVLNRVQQAKADVALGLSNPGEDQFKRGFRLSRRMAQVESEASRSGNNLSDAEKQEALHRKMAIDRLGLVAVEGMRQANISEETVRRAAKSNLAA